PANDLRRGERPRLDDRRIVRGVVRGVAAAAEVRVGVIDPGVDDRDAHAGAVGAEVGIALTAEDERHAVVEARRGALHGDEPRHSGDREGSDQGRPVRHHVEAVEHDAIFMENVHAGREEARLDGGLGLPQGGDERLLSRGVEGRATAVDPRLLLRGERISLQGTTISTGPRAFNPSGIISFVRPRSVIGCARSPNAFARCAQFNADVPTTAVATAWTGTTPIEATITKASAIAGSRRTECSAPAPTPSCIVNSPPREVTSPLGVSRYAE